MSKWIVKQDEVGLLARQALRKMEPIPSGASLYGIPRGGIPAAYAIAKESMRPLTIADQPGEATYLVDDVVDSGATRKVWTERFPGKPFVALIDKPAGAFPDRWIVWPWEGTTEGSFEGNIERLLQFIGEDPTRGGLRETPTRVARAWQFWCSGYGKDPAKVLKAFEDGAQGYDEMIVVRGIPFYSHCEHHLAPIFGTCSIGYVPDGRIVGLSKLSRLTDVFARRLQVQERLTNQIADSLQEHLVPRGVGVVIRARHLCMESRGVCQQGHETVTSALRGVLKAKPEARAEFFDLVKKQR